MTTANGLARYNRSSDSFTWYTRQDGLSSNKLRCLSFDENNGRWIATPGGVDYFDGNAFTHYGRDHGLIGARVSSLCYEPACKTTCVGNEYGVGLYKEGRVSP